MEEPKDFPKAPGSYHEALVIVSYLFIYLFIHLFIYLFIYLSIYLFIYLFIYLYIYLIIYLCICLFIYLSIYFLMLINFYNLSPLKLFGHKGAVFQRCSPRQRCFAGVMWILRAHPCMSVISIKFQSGVAGVALLHICSLVGSFRICTIFLLENTSGGLLLNIDNFIYNF